MKTYEEAREHAQLRANETGRDFAIEYFALYKQWEVRGLPRPEHRYGCDLSCEVVRPEVMP